MFVEGDGSGSGEEQVVTEGEHEESQGADGSSPESGRSTPRAIPYERFQEVTRQNQQYKKSFEDYQRFGSPQEIAQKIQRLDELSKTNKWTPDEKTRIREELLEHLPEVKDYMAFKQAQSQTFVQSGEARLPKFMKEAGRDPNDAELNRDIQEMMAGRIARNKDFLRRFAGNDPTVYDDVWKQIKPHFVRRPIIPGADLQGKKLPPNANGKTVHATGPAKPPADKSERELMDEAHEEAWARINASAGDE